MRFLILHVFQRGAALVKAGGLNICHEHRKGARYAR